MSTTTDFLACKFSGLLRNGPSPLSAHAGRSINPGEITALFTNMQILKFKSQLMIAFFTAVNHLKEPLRKQNFTLMGSKGHGL